VSAKNRRLARILALQALYELDCTQHSIADVMTARLDSEPPQMIYGNLPIDW